MADILTFGDQLRVEGINFKGFGILPKYVMLDRDLTIEAKTIYAYFCSFAGNGDTTFPGRAKILADLSLSKNGYYKHFHLLTEQGYLKVTQEKVNNSRFAKNIYTLVSNPKKFLDKPEEPSQNQVYSRIRFDGLKAAGYGMIPKAVMVDPRLPLKAKGIYAYFCSFTGAGNTAFPKKSQILYHLGISEKTYYKFYDVLTTLNYIRAVQRHTGGRLQVNDYILCDNPDTAKAAPRAFQIVSSQDCKKRDTEELQCCRKEDTEELQYGNLEDTRKQDTKIQDTEKRDTNRISPTKTNLGYNQSLTQQTAQPSFLPAEPEGFERARELYPEEDFQFNSLVLNATEEILEAKALPYYLCQNKDLMTEIVHWMTEWETFHPAGYQDELRQRVYELFNLSLIEMLTATKRTMSLKGAVVSYAKVVDKLNERAVFESYYVDLSEFMEPAMENYIRGAENTEIRNPTYYMMACIWDAMQTGNIGLYEQLRRDGFGT